jgi:magnesium transporter
LVGAHLSVVSNQLNQVMRVLTVVSTILMSMTLVAGIYGMNFKRMPELQWANGYPMALGLMAAIGFFGVWLFRKLDWL